MTIPPTVKKRHRSSSSSSSVVVVETPPETPKRFKDSTTPTEEEVDQFFAILAKMHVAVKYFESTTRDGGWRKALENDVVDLTATGADDNPRGDSDKSGAGRGGSMLLDLNETPIGDDLI